MRRGGSRKGSTSLENGLEERWQRKRHINGGQMADRKTRTSVAVFQSNPFHVSSMKMTQVFGIFSSELC